jgi:hypothetical protein
MAYLWLGCADYAAGGGVTQNRVAKTTDTHPVALAHGFFICNESQKEIVQEDQTDSP